MNKLLRRRHDPFDFLSGRQKAWWRRHWKPVVIVVGLVVGLGALLIPPVYGTVKAARNVKRHLSKAQQLVVAQRFEDAEAAVADAKQGVVDARRSFRPLRALSWVPGVGANVRAGNGLLDVADTGVGAVEKMTVFVRELLEPLEKHKGTLSYNALSTDERTGLLQRLGNAEPTLTALRLDVTTLMEQLDALPHSVLTSRVEKELGPIRDNFLVLDEALERAAPLAQVLPVILGHEKTQTYLFLLQNNTELRPSGGFIGTYGSLKVRNGEITSFTTDNSYNLDERAKDRVTTLAPEPLRRYNSAEKWFFRDANWSPDFSVSAQTALRFYTAEGGREKFDGTISVTPTFIEALLRLTGPLTIEGLEFTAENFTDTLQDQVTFDFAQQGIAQADRKNIVGQLGQELMKRLFALPQNQWSDLWAVLLSQLNEKQLLLYFGDSDLQAFAEGQNWAGRVVTPESDAIMVVDANLASLKSDPFVQHTIQYDLDAAKDQPTATVKITYTHTGEFSRKVTRYRTYVRLYVPLGATLLSSEGADLTDRSTRPGTVSTSEELGKTVFAAFKSIEPSTTESLSVTYTLPESLVQHIRAGRYGLLVQKQPGTVAHSLKLQLRFAKSVHSLGGIDNTAPSGDTLFAAETDIRRDRQLTLTIGP